MHKKTRIALLASALAVMLLAAWLLGHRSRADSTLRSYRAALIAQGEKLTFAELTASYTQRTNDSHQALTNAVLAIGAQKLYPGGLEPRKYIAPGRAQPIWQQEAPNWGTGLGPVPTGSWAEFAAELDRIQQPLQQLRQELKDPSPDAGPLTNVWARRIDFVKIRSAAHWLMGACLSELHQGHREEALEDLEALAGLARLDRDEYTLVAQMIRTAVVGLGTATTWELLQARGWTEPELARLQRAWGDVDPVRGLEKAMLGERAFGEEFWLQAHQPASAYLWSNIGWGSGGGRSLEELFRNHVLFPVYKLTSMDQDMLFRLQNLQEAVCQVRALEHHRPWPETRQAVDQLVVQVNLLAKSPQRFRYWFSLMSIPNFARAAQIVARNETERQMTLAAIALERFRLQQHRFPARLQDLVPTYLAEVPYDPMSGGPLCYQLKADGQFLLYSVGEDGKDDGGDARPASPGPKPGLWDGRDAVWPSGSAAPK